MIVTIEIDDELLKKARDYMGIHYNSELVHVALKCLCAREAGRRIAALGGSDPNAILSLRRRSSVE
jgi:Arc/MetJ family transcription regulator